MESIEQFTNLTTLIGEPARATMLWNLLDGKAYTAGELALSAGLSPQAASNHLHKLVEGGLLRMEKQGKHRYYCFARHEIAYAVEGLANLVPDKRTMIPAAMLQNGDIRYARTCYDHLAGQVAVSITDALIRQRVLRAAEDAFVVTKKGMDWFGALDIDAEALQQQKRAFAKPCLDWTERRHHLAGALGAALLDQLVVRHWVRRKLNDRTVILTAKGQQALERLGLIGSKTGNQ